MHRNCLCSKESDAPTVKGVLQIGQRHWAGSLSPTINSRKQASQYRRPQGMATGDRMLSSQSGHFPTGMVAISARNIQSETGSWEIHRRHFNGVHTILDVVSDVVEAVEGDGKKQIDGGERRLFAAASRDHVATRVVITRASLFLGPDGHLQPRPRRRISHDRDRKR